jgi:insecticidal toxin complex protein TccC
MNLRHDTATPTLSVIDPRSLAIRSVGYCRHPDQSVIEPRITRQVFDEAGRLAQSWDPRLWGTAPKPNLATTYGLTGQALLTDSVDAGWQLSLLDQAGSVRSVWDARGSQRHNEFDEQLRPIAVTEQALGESPNVVERLTYADADNAFAQHNQCGQLIRHEDPGGHQLFSDYGLAGAVLVESRRFLTELETPDWPLDLDARDEFLEEQSFVTRYSFNPTGELRRQTDAMGNVRMFHYDLSGKTCEAWLLQTGEGKQPQCLVSNIRYNAHDQIESETAGNGVTTRAEYGADDGRLLRLVAGVANQKPLQDLNYLYDPVGNIIAQEDKSHPVTHFNNQRIEPISCYRYDSLYQLVEAKGWEVATPSHGPALPGLLPTPLDPNQRRNYTQTFDYDPAGNLITRHHSDAPGFSMFTSARSNRSLAQRDDSSLPDEADFALGFDACGNQRELQRGQAMSWDVRNQLNRVTLVRRKSEPDDYECYVYDRPGHRLQKVSFSQTSGQTLCTEVRYLPGLEIHRASGGEERHVISVEAGRNHVRALHWPRNTGNDHLRYSLSDHLGSGTLELDDGAGVLTQEHYYPFGGTACWAGKSEGVANYKTIRYSGKERDATGLYYYGYRYCAPWLQRWVSTDPAAQVNGLNIYGVVGNNPISKKDIDGRFYEGEGDKFENNIQLLGDNILGRGLKEFSVQEQEILGESLKDAATILKAAINNIFAQPESARELLKPYVSKDESAVNRVVESWSRTLDLVKDYRSELGRDKFVKISGGGRSNALVQRPDFHGRVFIRDTVIQSGLALTSMLIHELSHLKRVNRLNAVGPATSDFYYVPVKRDVGDAEYLETSRTASEKIITGGLTGDYYRGAEKAAKVFAIEVATLSEGKLSTLGAAVSTFNGNPSIRANISSRTADVIAMSAIAVSGLYSNGKNLPRKRSYQQIS